MRVRLEMSALIFLPRGERNRNSSNEANGKRVYAYVRACVRVRARADSTSTLHFPRLPKGGAPGAIGGAVQARCRRQSTAREPRAPPRSGALLAGACEERKRTAAASQNARSARALCSRGPEPAPPVRTAASESRASVARLQVLLLSVCVIVGAPARARASLLFLRWIYTCHETTTVCWPSQ